MPKKPNILLVITDQQRSDYIGHSSVPVRTPHFDALIDRGIGFRNAICPSPLCGPSRICLAANTEYDNCGVLSNANYPHNQPTMYERLRDQGGYETIGVGDIDLIRSPYWGLNGDHQLGKLGFSDGLEIPGKMAMLKTYESHLSNRANRHGTYDPERLPPDVSPDPGEPATAYLAFLRDRGLLDVYIEDLQHRLRRDEPLAAYSTTEPCPLPTDAYVDNWVGANGLEYLRTAPQNRPWFLGINFVGPHPPLDVTEEMHDWYRNPPVDFPSPIEPSDDLDPETHQEIRRNYAAMCETIDRWLGRYIDTLQERGEFEETLVVFSSDHGELLGDYGAWSKESPRSASTGIPLGIAGPGVQPMGLVDEPVSLIDLHPTLLEAAGVQTKGAGVSMWPFLKNETDAHRSVVRSGLENWRLVFDGRYRLIVGDNLAQVNGMPADVDSPVLYDHTSDPPERIKLNDGIPPSVDTLASQLPAGFETSISG